MQMIPQLAMETITDGRAVQLYLVYAVIAVAMVVWLARTLHKNGALFLHDVFEDERLAGAVNHLLVVGFYLLNLGYALLLYKVQEQATLTLAVNSLVQRLGALMLSLGVIHLTNMFVFWRIRTYRDRKGGMNIPNPTAFRPPPPAPGSMPTPPAMPAR